MQNTSNACASSFSSHSPAKKLDIRKEIEREIRSMRLEVRRDRKLLRLAIKKSKEHPNKDWTYHLSQFKKILEMAQKSLKAYEEAYKASKYA